MAAHGRTVCAPTKRDVHPRRLCHSEAPEGPWESVPPVREIRIATSGLRPSSQGRIMVQHLRRGGLWPPGRTGNNDHLRGARPLDAPPIMRAPRSRPRPASLGPLGQFTSSRAKKNAPCRAGACPRRRLCVLLSMFSVGAAPCGRPPGIVCCKGTGGRALRAPTGNDIHAARRARPPGRAVFPHRAFCTRRRAHT